MKEIVISKTDANQRLDRFLLKYLKSAARSHLFALLRKKIIKVKGKACREGYLLHENDTIEIHLDDSEITRLTTVQGVPKRKREYDLDIVYEDDELLVLNKAAGLLTHPDATEYKKTLTAFVHNQFPHLCTRMYCPAPINRLDKNTTGLVMFCKTKEAAVAYNEAMRSGEIRKYYQSLVHGRVKKKGVVRGFLTKDEGENRVILAQSSSHHLDKYVETAYSVIESTKDYSFIEVELLTGRLHQIRVSMASIGHPLVGDTKYGGQRVGDISTQCLHAYKIVCAGKIFEKKSELLVSHWNALLKKS